MGRREVNKLSAETGHSVSSVGVSQDSLCIVHGRIEGHSSAAFVCHLFTQIVSSQEYLLVVDDVVVDEPIRGVVESLALVLTVCGSPFQFVVLNVVFTLLSSLSSPFQYLNYSSDFDEIWAVDS